MKIGLVGLGRMGANMTLRLLRAGHAVVAFDQTRAAGAPCSAYAIAAATRKKVRPIVRATANQMMKQRAISALSS